MSKSKTSRDKEEPPSYSGHHPNQVAPYPVVSQPGYGQHPGYGYGSPGHASQQTSNNTVVINTGGTQQPTVKQPRLWSTGLCDCCSDMGVCCCGLFCGPCQACQIATDMGESCCVPCCVPAWLIVLRTKMRAQENIQGSVMDDCCTVMYCGMCVQCQLAREAKFVRARGNMMV